MSEKYFMMELHAETRWWKFLFARIFGKKLVKNMYMYRGKVWVTGKVEEPL